MSLRRGNTVSPLMGWPPNAGPSAFQSLSVPSSKSRLSGWPSLPTGLMPWGRADTRAMGTTNIARQTVTRTKRNVVMENLSQFPVVGSRRIVLAFSFNSWLRAPQQLKMIESMPKALTVEELQKEAASFAKTESDHEEPTLFGVTDGKAVGTYLEHKFQQHLQNIYDYVRGRSRARARKSMVLAMRCSFSFITSTMMTRGGLVAWTFGTRSSSKSIALEIFKPHRDCGSSWKTMPIAKIFWLSSKSGCYQLMRSKRTLLRTKS